MSIWTKIAIFFTLTTLFVGLIFLIRYLRKRWIDYQSNKDRTYNQFDKAEFTANEISNLKRWNFVVPEGAQHNVTSELKEVGNDYEIIVTFN